MHFTEEYYKSKNYHDYLDRYGRYQKLAGELDGLFKSLGLQTFLKYGKVLDYGCAVGFLIKALSELGYEDIYGVEISKWAKDICRKDGIKIASERQVSIPKNLIFFLDVLEHISNDDIYKIFNKITSDFIIVRIPVTTKDNGEFVLDISENDPTHINRKTKQSWIALLDSLNYELYSTINLNTIWDSKGVFCAIFKEKSVKMEEILDL
jgi:SAM-dependent methyltransferase